MQEKVFRALADRTRRAILDALSERDGRTLTELQGLFPMTRFGVMKHLRVLEEAGLVVPRKVGREKFHYLNRVPIREIHDRWISRFAEGAGRALLGLRSGLEEGGAMEGKPSHVFQLFIRTTPERLWEAITSSDFTRRYYFSSTVESSWRPSSPYMYAMGGERAIVGEVLEADPPRRLVMTFDARWDEEVATEPPSRLTWEIEPAGEGVCKLTVIHDGFEGETPTYRQVHGGWPLVLSGLKTLLETGEPLVAAAEPGSAS